MGRISRRLTVLVPTLMSSLNCRITSSAILGAAGFSPVAGFRKYWVTTGPSPSSVRMVIFFTVSEKLPAVSSAT